MPNPGQVGRDLHVDAGHIHLAASDAPGHHADHVPDAVALADQRTAAITLAGILALLAAGADEARIEFVAVAETRVAQLRLALMVGQNWHIDFLEDVLVFAVLAEGVLAPAGGPAASVGEVGILIGQTGGTDVWVLGEVDGVIQLQYSQIVVQGASIVLGMNVHRDNIALNVGEELDVMIDIPFAQAHAQIESILTAEGNSRLVQIFWKSLESTYDLMQWAAEMMCWASMRVPPQA